MTFLLGYSVVAREDGTVSNVLLLVLFCFVLGIACFACYVSEIAPQHVTTTVFPSVSRGSSQLYVHVQTFRSLS